MAQPARKSAEHEVNGVKVDQFQDTIQTIKAQPNLAKATFRAQNRWLTGGHNRSTIQEFIRGGQKVPSDTRPFTVDADEPRVIQGEDQAPSPVEHVLHALAACLTTALVYDAAARGIRLDEVESTLEGDWDARGFLGLANDVRNGLQNIRVTFRIKGDAPDEVLAELCERGAKSSPVFDIVTNRVPVSVKLERAA